MKKVTEYEVIDHGFEHGQYFQGCGTSFTRFDDVATGTGYDAREAFEDALDSLAQADWDTSKIKGKSRLSKQGVKGFLRSMGEPTKESDMEECEIYAFVSIRVRGEK